MTAISRGNDLKMKQLQMDTYASEYGGQTVRFRIDGVDLRDLLRDAELAMGATPAIAGVYDGPQVAVIEPPSRHMFGEPASGWISSASVPGTVLLLGCTCGTEGCWPLHVRIEVQEQLVRWSAFINPFREEWTYAGLGPFEFEMEQYRRELEALKESVTLGSSRTKVERGT